MLYDTHLVELYAGERVHNGVVLENIVYDSLGLHVVFLVALVRLVGYVEITLLIKITLLEHIKECGDELPQEVCILFTDRVGVPAKIFLVTSIDLNDDLGSSLCAPLSKEVRNFEVFNAALQSKVDPTVELVKIECEFAFGNKLDVNKLSGKTLTANVCVKLGSEYGGQNHVDAVANSNLHEVFNVLPVLFGKSLNVVIVCNTVCVEPLCVNKFLLGKFCRKNTNFCLGRCKYLFGYALLVKGYRKIVSASLKILGQLNVKP